MNKQEFLDALGMRLSVLPKQDVEERLNFYSEMIDDRMEEGITEEESVLEIGSVEEIAAQIIADTPKAKIKKGRSKHVNQLKAWTIALLVLGSPIWLSLAIAAFSIILSLYFSLWSVIISLWAVFGSLIGCAVGGIAAGLILAVCGNGITGIAIIGAGIFCAGLTILMFFGCNAATKGIILLTKKLPSWVKKCFAEKEAA
jgi:uncharacterized membrane protein